MHDRTWDSISDADHTTANTTSAENGCSIKLLKDVPGYPWNYSHSGNLLWSGCGMVECSIFVLILWNYSSELPQAFSEVASVQSSLKHCRLFRSWYHMSDLLPAYSILNSCASCLATKLDGCVRDHSVWTTPRNMIVSKHMRHTPEYYVEMYEHIGWRIFPHYSLLESLLAVRISSLEHTKANEMLDWTTADDFNSVASSA